MHVLVYIQRCIELARHGLRLAGITAANMVWMAASYPAYRRFCRALRQPRITQAAILADILKRNAASTFGRAHQFAKVSSVADFQRAVPLTNYDALSPHIAGIRSGQDAASLTGELVRIFEKSSGSSAAAKYIPYTESLRHEFQAAVRAWIFDLYRNEPRLLCGRSYWLITPLNREREVTPSGIPVGFDSDAEYLGVLERRIAETLFAVPSSLAHVQSMESSLYLTLRFLLQAEDLALISVWNPSYLCILMERLPAWAPQLLDDLKRGTATLPAQGTADTSPDPGSASGAVTQPPLPASLTQRLLAQPARAGRLTQILQLKGRLTAANLWPGLRLISCWTEAAARQSLGDVARHFPGVRVQGKGLLATEGVVTIPWTSAGGCIPAVMSHFYEFLPADGRAVGSVADGDTRLVHELERGAVYSLAITTGGGLYRYKLGDQVRIRGFCPGAPEVPVLEFVGRDDGISDLRGEKLSPAFVQSALDSALGEAGLAEMTSFAMLAPHAPAGGDAPCYVFYLQLVAPSTNCVVSLQTPPDLAHLLDRALRANPHYDYCRELGQLSELLLFSVTSGAQETYVQRCMALGQRAGNIKPTSLHRANGWERSFCGCFVDRADAVNSAETRKAAILCHEGALC